MKLENIGFYTLSDVRADTASSQWRIMRAELLLGERCNFSCPYCRHVGGPDITLEEGNRIIDEWIKHNLYAIRFSGGEPTVNAHLGDFVKRAKEGGVVKIAISTNGSADWDVYEKLIALGVNDFSVSLDACCAEDGDKMAGGVKGAWNTVIENIRLMSSKVYTTVGVVLTKDNIDNFEGIVKFADSLGVADIRVIPAAQETNMLREVKIEESILERHPILKYRINNIQNGVPVRGMNKSDYPHCGIVLDDMAVSEGFHFPCIIHMREGGKPIGKVGPTMREEREKWYKEHNTFLDPICQQNCLDCIVLYNNRFGENNSGAV